MNQLKHILAPAALSILLTACGSDDDNSTPIVEGSYAVQMVDSGYESSQIAIGNILGDRTAQNVLSSSQSDYTVASYKQYLYHIGKYAIDTISRYNSTINFIDPEWTYTTNEANTSNSSNTYTIVQNSDENAYLINYGTGTIFQVNPTATQYSDFIKDKIDLSEYTFNDGKKMGSSPGLAGGVIANNILFVIAQRLESYPFDEREPSYLIAIDLTSNTEIDTNPQQDGLKGIPLTAYNPSNVVAHNNSVYVAGRGNYRSISGGLDIIDATTFEVTNVINGTTFSELNNEDTSLYYHVADVAVVSDQKAYTSINTESFGVVKSSLIYEFNPSTQAIGEAINLTDHDNNPIGDIAVGPNNRLWVGTNYKIDDDSVTPKLLVVDTDTNTQNGDTIDLIFGTIKITFLDVE